MAPQKKLRTDPHQPLALTGESVVNPGAGDQGQWPAFTLSVAGFLIAMACVALLGAHGDWVSGLTLGAIVLFLSGGGLLFILGRWKMVQRTPKPALLMEIVAALPMPAALTDKDGAMLGSNLAYRAFYGAVSPRVFAESGTGDGGFPGSLLATDYWGYRLWTSAHSAVSQDLSPDSEILAVFDQGLTMFDVGFAIADEADTLLYVSSRLAAWLGVQNMADIPALTVRMLLDERRSDLNTSGDGTLLKSVQTMSLHSDQAEGEDKEPGKAVFRAVFVYRPKPSDVGVSDMDASLLRTLFDAAPIGLALVNSEGCLLEFNKAFERFAPNRMPRHGDILSSYMTMDDQDLMVAGLRAALVDGKAVSPREVGFNTQPARTGQVFITPLERNDNPTQESAALVHLIDTTQQRSLERQFVQAQKMQAVGQLAGGVAHDFNNLLTAIIGFCDLLLVRHGPGEQSFSDIMQIKQNANRAANLVRQLLAFSRQQTMRPKVLMVTDVLADLSNLLRRLIGESVRLHMIHGRDVGAVRVDQGQLEQVIINLAVNARDAMDNHGTLKIRTKAVGPDDRMVRHYSVMPPDHYVLIEMTDSGHGIPSDLLNKIFEPFFTTKDVGKGTGLGLSTVYGIIKQTGGFIFVESAPGEGATFRIYLPVHDQDGEEIGPQVEGPRDLTGKGTILLVEDEEAVRMFASRALTNKGYKVLQAASGEDALAIVREEEGRIDLMISDVVMPNMDGPTLVTKAMALRPDMHIIFISGYAEDVFRKDIGRAGQDFRFLPKPFSLKQLAETVKEVLG